MLRKLQIAKKTNRPTRTFSTKFRSRWRHVLLIDERIRLGRAPNCQQLAGELEVSRRTILRDIDFLKYDLGAPLEYDPSLRGYVYTEPNWSMPSVRITEGELFALMVAEQALEAHAGSPWASVLQRVFGRLIAALPDRIEVAPRELLPRVSFDASSVAVVDPMVLELIGQAIKQNKTLRITYTPMSTLLIKRHTVDPYALRLFRGAWYLAAREHRSGRVPMFNVSRIKHAEMTGGDFNYDSSEFDPKAYFGDTFGIYETGKRQRVVIRFTGPAARLVAERRWHKSQKIRPIRGIGVELSLEVGHLNDVLPWVLSWGPNAEVVQPGELRQLVIGQAQGILDRHRPTAAGKKKR